MDDAIKRIEAECWATEPSTLYLTRGPNFRDQIATVKKYKGTRKGNKPFHYKNITAYMENQYDVIWADGLEADDLLCVAQYKRLGQRDTIICSRDKDLKICPGFHYTWECGRQAAWGPKWVEPLGTLLLQRGGKKLSGTGLRFFYAQCLMGDNVDNIPGLGNFGPIKSYNALKDCTTEGELFSRVRELYVERYGTDVGLARLLEMGQLLWMVQELDEEDKPVMWEFPNE